MIHFDVLKPHELNLNNSIETIEAFEQINGRGRTEENNITRTIRKVYGIIKQYLFFLSFQHQKKQNLFSKNYSSALSFQRHKNEH